MNHTIAMALTAVIWGAAAVLKGQAISPPGSDKFPFQVGRIMDGGTLYILERATTKTPERRYCIDNQINSKTAGELFVGNLHPTHEGAKLVQGDKAKRILKAIEARLNAFHGAEKLEQYRKEPIDLEALSDEAAAEKAKDPGFNDRVATQILLEAIEEYRESHKVEPGGAEQPASGTKLKPETKNGIQNPGSGGRPE